MSQEFQGGVCEGNWWMMNSSQNFFRTSPCSSSISDFGWQNHDLAKNLESLSHENNPQILQEDANFLYPSMNYTQQNEYSPTLQDSSFDSLKNQSVFTATNHEQRLNPIASSSEDIASAYSYDSSMLLQHLFDTDSQEHESLLENLGLNYTQAMNCQITGSFDCGQKDISDNNHLQFDNNTQYWKDSTEFSCDVGASVSCSTTPPQFTASSFSRTKANKISNCAAKHHNEEKKTIINEQPTTAKRSRIETPSPLPSFKGCDASIIISSPNGKAEKDHPDNLSLAGDGFDTVVKAKAAVDNDPQCRNKVSCADILALATRDVVNLAGGPNYKVELGRRDGRTSTIASVQRRLPSPDFNLSQLMTTFTSLGLNMTDLIALSGSHTIGFSHCSRFARRIYNFSPKNKVDPTLNPQYATQLQQMCPKKVDPRIAINMDPTTPNTFDNAYYVNLQNRRGLFTSDETLFIDARSKATVNLFASNSTAFFQAFVEAITKLGRTGVLTGSKGEIRVDCTKPN